MEFKITYTRIKEMIIWFIKISLFILSLLINLLIVIISSPIWLPIVIWKSGLIVSDHIMNYITSD